jgi:hypothetical protein
VAFSFVLRAAISSITLCLGVTIPCSTAREVLLIVGLTTLWYTIRIPEDSVGWRSRNAWSFYAGCFRLSLFYFSSFLRGKWKCNKVRTTYIQIFFQFIVHNYSTLRNWHRRKVHHEGDTIRTRHLCFHYFIIIFFIHLFKANLPACLVFA